MKAAVQNAIVIGGGPAGSLAATLLARAGVAVTLIEQHRFPRDKVCGECLSALGRDVLRRHGLEATLAAIGVELRTAELFGRSAQATLKLPQPMLGVSRSAMDASLLNAAIDAGVSVRQPARVEALEPGVDGGLARVRVRSLLTNVVEAMDADVVLVADGRAAFADPKPAATGDLGVKAHFTSVAATPAAITLYGGIGCYGGAAPIEGGRWNVAFSVPRETVAAARGDLAAMWACIVRRSPALARHFRSAERVSDWLASPLPRHGPSSTWRANIIPIGATACAIEPVGGEGMGTALRSAELAADAILNHTTATLPAAYRSLWRRRSWACRLGGFGLADEAMSEAIELARQPVIASVAMRLVGK